jgi:hypothetical protein
MFRICILTVVDMRVRDAVSPRWVSADVFLDGANIDDYCGIPAAAKTSWWVGSKVSRRGADFGSIIPRELFAATVAVAIEAVGKGEEWCSAEC